MTNPQMPGPIVLIAPIAAILALALAAIFFKKMKSADQGNERMREIAGYVNEGAMAYLKQQYRVVGIFFGIGFILFLFMAYVLKVQDVLMPLGFLTGGFFSALCGWFGMQTSTQASSRTAQAASRGLNEGLQISFRSGAVMGLNVVGWALIFVFGWFLALIKIRGTGDLETLTVLMLNFGMGASFQALFARVGGGIFTKAADVGADLVGKVEAGIPEDDPRNPATIADNVGDNVGDVAGMGADLFESYAGSILAAAALGAAAYQGTALQMNAVIAPLVIAGVGVIASFAGIFAVKTREGASQGDLLKALGRGVNVSAVIITVGSAILVPMLKLPFGVFFSILSGLVGGIVIGKATEYYTAAEFKPTQWLAEQCKTGSATTIIGGLAVGMQSTVIPVLAIGATMLLAYGCSGGLGSADNSVALGLYGIGLAAVGMLSTLGVTLATDAYGPIADNAGGNAEMAGLPSEVRERTDALDSLGNTTAATGKGFAIGSAALTAMAMIAAYITSIKLEMISLHTAGEAEVRDMGLEGILHYLDVSFLNPIVLIGMFIGAMATFLFCALTMKAVGRAAGAVVEEVRRQFKEIDGLLEGREGVKADYAGSVGICTRSAQKEMVIPALLAVIIPLATGVVLGVGAVIGLLVGALTTGFVLAVMMANSGGAWDNAKKYIETGAHGGKGSEAHKAGVVGDTVGDPFKDTSGPSLNILIKLMSMVSIVFAGLMVKYPSLVDIVRNFFK